jgi:hypothetical protein
MLDSGRGGMMEMGWHDGKGEGGMMKRKKRWHDGKGEKWRDGKS